MNKALTISTVLLLLCLTMSHAREVKTFEMKSPDNNILLVITAEELFRWSVMHKDQQILEPSPVSLLLKDGSRLGWNPEILSSIRESVDTSFSAINYTKTIIPDKYNQLTIKCKGDYGLIFRVYNDGVAYRFFTGKEGEIIVANEVANFNFTADHKAWIPYMWDYRGDEIFNHSFEALYDETRISEFRKDSLAFLPLMVDAGNNKKVVILEADLEDYPGMYLDLNETYKGFKGVFARYPLAAETGGYENMNLIPTRRADYIARTRGTRSFPWRAIVISETDSELLDNDMVQKLASPSRIEDVSWIKPGQVAWDWWNDWDVTHVDFEAGMNTATFKFFTDFAAENGIPYINIDWGWSARMDLTDVNPDMNIQEIVSYARENNVGVILWATWYAIATQMDEIFPYYSDMGIKGFKIDFIDRDDQVAMASVYEIAEKAAEHKLIINYHGIFKPAGLQRTYPNIVNFEGVKGLENVKWADEDAPRYAVSIPFIRMMAGPMDYTPGAMRNATPETFRPIYSAPMSKGTRCHQLAMYVIYEAPLQMLADSPVMYRKEQECTDFITSIPVTFDETVALAGKVSEYAALARRKGHTWYVGAMTNWESRTLTLDFSFLDDGIYEAVIFSDGINANRNATDYKRDVVTLTSGDKLDIKLYNGGGWAARLNRLD